MKMRELSMEKKACHSEVEKGGTSISGISKTLGIVSTTTRYSEKKETTSVLSNRYLTCCSRNTTIEDTIGESSKGKPQNSS